MTIKIRKEVRDEIQKFKKEFIKKESILERYSEHGVIFFQARFISDLFLAFFKRKISIYFLEINIENSFILNGTKVFSRKKILEKFYKILDMQEGL